MELFGTGRIAQTLAIGRIGAYESRRSAQRTRVAERALRQLHQRIDAGARGIAGGLTQHRRIGVRSLDQARHCRARPGPRLGK
jgi:hypothetical protein